MGSSLREIVAAWRDPARQAAREPGSAGHGGQAAEYLAPRWRGQPGRLEVWYTTLTDRATGTGCWLHHELIAPDGGGEASAHGWAAIFPPDGPPVLARFGPRPWRAPGSDAVFAADDVVVMQRGLRGSAGARRGEAPFGHSHGHGHGHGHGADGIRWDLTMEGGGPPLFTFPRWAWAREILPGAQIVPAPAAVFHGKIRYGNRALDLAGAPGATAHTYGRGYPARWAWLHADLGAGDVCEVVAAATTARGLRRLPPLPFVRLRLAGRDWPTGDPMLHAVRFVARLGLPTWTVLGVAGDRRIRIQVTQPAERTVRVDYTGPDSATAVCTNSERADAVIMLQRRTSDGWRQERLWHLDATAHAEVGGPG